MVSCMDRWVDEGMGEGTMIDPIVPFRCRVLVEVS